MGAQCGAMRAIRVGGDIALESALYHEQCSSGGWKVCPWGRRCGREGELRTVYPGILEDFKLFFIYPE